MDFTLSLTTETSRFNPPHNMYIQFELFYHILQIWIQRHRKWPEVGTSLCTCSATHTIGFKKGYIVTLDNPGVKSSGRHAEYQFTLHFVARPYASVAIYTFGKIHGHIGMAKVFLSVQMIFPLHILIPYSHSGSYCL